MKFYGLFVFALAALFLSAVAALPRNTAFEGGENYVFYCGDSSKNCREVHPSQNPSIAKLSLFDVCGEGAEYESLDLNSFLKSVNGKIVFKEELADSVNYYCTADMPYKVTLYGKEINLHVCVKKDGVKVGTPIIFGGY